MRKREHNPSTVSSTQIDTRRLDQRAHGRGLDALPKAFASPVHEAPPSKHEQRTELLKSVRSALTTFPATNEAILQDNKGLMEHGKILASFHNTLGTSLFFLLALLGQRLHSTQELTRIRLTICSYVLEENDELYHALYRTIQFVHQVVLVLLSGSALGQIMGHGRKYSSTDCLVGTRSSCVHYLIAKCCSGLGGLLHQRKRRRLELYYNMIKAYVSLSVVRSTVDVGKQGSTWTSVRLSVPHNAR
jgi:hypothetical protein